MGSETPKNFSLEKLVKSWTTNGLTVSRSNNGPYFMTVDQDSLQPLSHKSYVLPAWFVGGPTVRRWKVCSQLRGNAVGST